MHNQKKNFNSGICIGIRHQVQTIKLQLISEVFTLYDLLLGDRNKTIILIFFMTIGFQNIFLISCDTYKVDCVQIAVGDDSQVFVTYLDGLELWQNLLIIGFVRGYVQQLSTPFIGGMVFLALVYI